MTDLTSVPAAPDASRGTPESSTQGRRQRRRPERNDMREGRKGCDWQGIAQFFAAFCIIGVYVASMWLMVRDSNDPGPQWDRLVFLFTGFEAIVFVAAGAIFGTRVQRASVEAAQEESRQAREDLGAEQERAARADELEES